jgi:hypothetical protein
MRGTLIDDSGVALGAFEVHPVPINPVKEFPYSIQVTRVDGRRWFLSPTGVSRPTDTGAVLGGPLLWQVQEFLRPRPGQSIDRAHPSRDGEMISNPYPGLSDHMEGSLAFRPVPEPEGANWIYSASFQMVHFLSEKIIAVIVSKTGRYTIDESRSLELADNHGVITGAIVIGNRRRAIRAHAYGSFVLGTIEGTAEPGAVKTRLTLTFDTGGQKVTGSCEETDERGNVFAGTEKTFVATRLR